jgi:hypothetical protein
MTASFIYAFLDNRWNICFSYSFLDGVRKYHVEILDSPLEKYTGKDYDTGTKFNKHRSFLVQDGVACEYKVVWKVVSKVLRKYGVCEVRWRFWYHHTKAQIHNFWSWNLLRKLGPETQK